jgi:SAM-dependent methyltransferase
MTNWGEGYVTEVGYTHGFYRELTPHLLAFAALSRGFRAPSLGDRPVRILELGCGQGFSANLISAANPDVDYTAIDFGPAHIVGARELAAAANVSNVHFLEASFEQIAADRAMGEFDLVTLHGVYSWVSAENRDHIIRIARDKLKAGGMLYVSYNTFPGWASFVPIRQMILDAANAAPTAALAQRLEQGFKLFNRLVDVGARSVAGSPGLVEILQKMQKMGSNYLAHELLNHEWKIFHFAEVAADMAAAKLTHIGSARVLQNLDAFNFSPAQQSLLFEIADPVHRQSVGDLIVNQRFRTDIFGKGAPLLRPSEASSRL